MPVTYPGDPTATEAPSNPPNPDSGPSVVLPVDGDVRNAASLEQALKVLADFAAWNRDPRTLSALVGSWEQRTWGVKNARAQRKWFLDHMGHPAGRIVKWVETWQGADSKTLAGGASPFAATDRRWIAGVTDAGSFGNAIRVKYPADAGVPSTKLSKVVLFSITTGTVGDQLDLYDNPEHIFSADNSFSLEVDIWGGASGLSTHQLFVALTDNAALPGVVGFKGAGFYTDGAGSNWKAVTGDGAAVHVVDTGVAVTGAGWQALRIEWWGANVADDSAAACRFYIEDILKADIAVNLPTGTYVGKYLSAKKASGATALAAYIGPVQMTYNY